MVVSIRPPTIVMGINIHTILIIRIRKLAIPDRTVIIERTIHRHCLRIKPIPINHRMVIVANHIDTVVEIQVGRVKITILLRLSIIISHNLVLTIIQVDRHLRP